MENIQYQRPKRFNSFGPPGCFSYTRLCELEERKWAKELALDRYFEELERENERKQQEEEKRKKEAEEAAQKQAEEESQKQFDFVQEESFAGVLVRQIRKRKFEEKKREKEKEEEDAFRIAHNLEEEGASRIACIREIVKEMRLASSLNLPE